MGGSVASRLPEDGRRSPCWYVAYLPKDPVYANDTSGCTAVAALLVPEPGSSSGRRMYCANSGDSRCVLGLAGEAKPMSYDHKPSNPEEHSRILNAGGFVEFDRVNGNLALSRALGDFEFKQNASLPAEEQIVTADPQVISHDYTGEEEFLVLACDGIWDCLSNQQVVDLVRRGVAQGKELDTITEDIIDRCLAPDAEVGGIGCDNVGGCAHADDTAYCCLARQPLQAGVVRVDEAACGKQGGLRDARVGSARVPLPPAAESLLAVAVRRWQCAAAQRRAFL